MNSKPKIILTEETHKEMDVVTLRFNYNLELIGHIKKLEGAKWSQSKKCWYFLANKGIHQKIREVLGKYSQIEYKGTEISADKNRYSKDELEEITKSGTVNTNKPDIVVETDSKKNQILISFKYEENWKNEVKKLDGAWWHIMAKLWSVHLNETNLERIKEIFTSENSNLIIKEIEHLPSPKQKHKTATDRSIVDKKFITQLKLLNRKENTINNYQSMVAHYLQYFKGEDIATISEEKMRNYILDHRERQGYSESYQRLMISALKNYYKIVFGRELKSDEIPYPERSRPLPKVISREDVEKMIQLTVNPKHKMILLFLYGLGLRRGELANLKVNDIDFKRNTINIYRAKGNKDRTLPIPGALLKYLENYLRDYLPRDYFLVGQEGGKYSPESILKVVKKSAERAKVKMVITPHILRHCFATHSLEKGIDLRYIQAMLGHKSSKTTEIYTYVSTKQLNKLSNPLDDIKF